MDEPQRPQRPQRPPSREGRESGSADSHLKLSARTVGLLINFNVKLLKDGVRRFVN